VECVLYRLRRWGERLADDEVKVSAQPGRLVFSAVPGAAQFFVGERLIDQLVNAKSMSIRAFFHSPVGWRPSTLAASSFSSWCQMSTLGRGRLAKMRTPTRSADEQG